MEATTERESGPPELETAEGFAAYVSDALATRDRAVIEKAFATVARTGGKSRAEAEAAPPRESLDPARERRAPELSSRAAPSSSPEGTRKKGAPKGAPKVSASESPLHASASWSPAGRQRGSGARRFGLAGVVIVGALAAFCAGSLSLNAPERPQPPLSKPTPRYAQAAPRQAPHAAPQSLAATSSDAIARLAAQRMSLAAQRMSLAARVRALAAQLKAETARFDELHDEAGQTARQLASLPAITAQIAANTEALDDLRTRIKQARRKLAVLNAPHAPVRVASATPVSAPTIRYSPMESLERQWHREDAQLIAARSALSAGDAPEARQLIEAVQTQLVFQPVTPDDPIPSQGTNPTARELGEALALLDQGQAMEALQILDRAIAYLGA
ncbi:MAG TPA: hypothetical protein VMF62_10930 [Acetobacteraceae bacterium]|nr:hypothetical protein [Acetobacteraceae bacterium]